MALFGYSREAVRVKVKKCEGSLQPEWRKFSVDPQITSLEVLYSILAKAFDLKTDFAIHYRTLDPSGHEIYLPVLSDWDLDAAFLRTHNLSLSTTCEPCLNLRVDIKPFSEASDWDVANSSNTSNSVGGISNSGGVNNSNSSGGLKEISSLQQSFGVGHKYVQNMQNRLPGLIMNQMEKTFSMVTRALNFVEDQNILQPPRPPLCDTEFRTFLDSVGQIVYPHELRKVIYSGGIDPSLRRVVWKHILNVYPDGMTGRERMDYMKRKASEYYRLREIWRVAIQRGSVIGELAYVTSMVRKDVLRTDRLHPFYAGSDDNQNIASLFNILTTYALNHPAVSYCQGMSDIASPLLVTMSDEAQAYICFCAVMQRLSSNFMLDGIAMTLKFSHLSEALQHYDPEFYEYLKIQQADDLLFCYRWLLLEMKREFAFEDSLRMLEVLWSALPAEPPIMELPLFEKEFNAPPVEVTMMVPPKSPSIVMMRQPRENAYTKICALRRQSSAMSLISTATTGGGGGGGGGSCGSPAASSAYVSRTTTPPPSSLPTQPFNSSLSSSSSSSLQQYHQHQLATIKSLDSTKRLNHSLDENLSHCRVVQKNIVSKTHQSLDESKMLMILDQSSIDYTTNTTETTMITDTTNDIVNIAAVSSSDALNDSDLPTLNLLEINKNEENILRSRSTSPPSDTSSSNKSPTHSSITNSQQNQSNIHNHQNHLPQHSHPHPHQHHHHHHHLHNQYHGKHNNKPMSTLNNISSLSKQLHHHRKGGGGGHFKELKERIAAGKKGIFTSIEQQTDTPQKTAQISNDTNEVTTITTITADKPSNINNNNNNNNSNNNNDSTPTTKTQKVVKNFNEFLNFASINKSRISDKLITTNRPTAINNDTTTIKQTSISPSTTKPLIKLTNSSFDESEILTTHTQPLVNSSSSSLSNTDVVVDADLPSSSSSTSSPPPPTLQQTISLHSTTSTINPVLQPLQLIIGSEQRRISIDGSSPDDSQEYYPMTTSMTRELRLELESLDRHVFGNDYQHQRQQQHFVSIIDTPENGEAIISTVSQQQQQLQQQQQQHHQQHSNDFIDDYTTEISYTKLKPTDSTDILDDDVDDAGGGDNIYLQPQQQQPPPFSNDVEEICQYPNDKDINILRHRIRNGESVSDNTFKRISTSSANTDIFIWENPLHQFSPSSTTLDFDGIVAGQKSIGIGGVSSGGGPIGMTSGNSYDDILTTTDDMLHSITPDEQIDLEYDDGEGDIETMIMGKKSVTPIRFVRKNMSGNSSEFRRKQQSSAGGRNGGGGGGGGSTLSSKRNSANYSLANDSDTTDSEDSWNENNLTMTTKIGKSQSLPPPLPPPPISSVVAAAAAAAAAQLQLQTESIEKSSSSLIHETKNNSLMTENTTTTTTNQLLSTSVEEASEANVTLTRVAGSLPSPDEFGGGNPFLMFLCLTLLLQHRNYVIKSAMDYNEMAMHFDKMVRKHNVTRVLNQARRMYADYLKSQKIINSVGGGGGGGGGTFTGSGNNNTSNSDGNTSSRTVKNDVRT